MLGRPMDEQSVCRPARISAFAIEVSAASEGAGTEQVRGRACRLLLDHGLGNEIENVPAAWALAMTARLYRANVSSAGAAPVPR